MHSRVHVRGRVGRWRDRFPLTLLCIISLGCYSSSFMWFSAYLRATGDMSARVLFIISTIPVAMVFRSETMQKFRSQVVSRKSLEIWWSNCRTACLSSSIKTTHHTAQSTAGLLFSRTVVALHFRVPTMWITRLHVLHQSRSTFDGIRASTSSQAQA
jgi:hypothetical protein